MPAVSDAQDAHGPATPDRDPRGRAEGRNDQGCVVGWTRRHAAQFREQPAPDLLPIRQSASLTSAFVGAACCALMHAISRHFIVCCTSVHLAAHQGFQSGRQDLNLRPPGPQSEGWGCARWITPVFVGCMASELLWGALKLDPKLDPKHSFA